jgi:translation initiation factor IF-3
LRINREIRAPKVRVIDKDGSQLGIFSSLEALQRAEAAGLDLVEIAPTAHPPVCKIIDYGKFRYEQTKKERESKKAQHRVKVKEVKIKPNTDEHDLSTKIKQAREFLRRGDKVRLVCAFRGREMLRPELGDQALHKICEELGDVSLVEVPAKLMGRTLSLVLAPGSKKKPVVHEEKPKVTESLA